MPRVGVLWHAASPEAEEEYLGALTKAFHELGYFEGKNIELDHRFPGGTAERHHKLPGRLAESKGDGVAPLTGLGAREANIATSRRVLRNIACTGERCNGLVESLARPG